MAILNTKGLILDSIDFRETSKICTFFSKDYGKIKGILKGARSSPSKFKSNLDKFSLNHLVFYTSRNSQLHLVSQCDMIKDFSPSFDKILYLYAANLTLELIDKIMPSEEKNEPIYELLLDTLEALRENDSMQRALVSFELKVLSLSGFEPHINSCVSCFASVDDEAYFSTKLGGLLCKGCRGKDPLSDLVSGGLIATINYILNSSVSAISRLKINKAVADKLQQILSSFLVFHAQIDPKLFRIPGNLMEKSSEIGNV